MKIIINYVLKSIKLINEICFIFLSYLVEEEKPKESIESDITVFDSVSKEENVNVEETITENKVEGLEGTYSSLNIQDINIVIHFSQ